MAQKNDNKRLFILLGILGVLLVYLILSRTVFSKSKPTPTQRVNNVNTVVNVPVETISKNRQMVVKRINNPNYVVPKFEYNGIWLNDPFFYLDEDSLEALRERELGQYTRLTLTGISLHDDGGYSLINSVVMTDVDTIMTASVLKEGDEFKGYRVEKIEFDHVILSKGNRKIRLELDDS
jgi:hypothetical protein